MAEPVKVPFAPKVAAEIVRLTQARLNFTKGHLAGLDLADGVTVQLHLDDDPPFYTVTEPA